MYLGKILATQDGRFIDENIINIFKQKVLRNDYLIFLRSHGEGTRKRHPE